MLANMMLQAIVFDELLAHASLAKEAVCQRSRSAKVPPGFNTVRMSSMMGVKKALLTLFSARKVFNQAGLYSSTPPKSTIHHPNHHLHRCQTLGSVATSGLTKFWREKPTHYTA